MTWVATNHTVREEENQYATPEDLCTVFTENLSGLYQLSFVLTGNNELAAQCFVAGFEESTRANQVFKEWAHAWAKRTIAQNAVRALQLRPKHDDSFSPAVASPKDTRLPENRAAHFDLSTVLALEDFDRFVFVLTVLDRYTEQECADLLNCPVKKVSTARFRAFEQIVNLHRESFSHETAKNLQEANR
jgi:DNA-directed RNA polymerase specialized sigma24 family protein